MTVNKHWMYQGRQQHGWFGHGTGPGTEGAAGPAGGLFDPLNASQRADYAGASVIGHLDWKDRGRWQGASAPAARIHLRTAVAAWYGAAGLGRDAFRDLLLDPSTGDATVDRLRAAARGIVEAQNTAELGAAGSDLAAAVRGVGVERWPRYLASAERRAVAAASDGAISGVQTVSAAGTDVPVSIALGVLLLGGAALLGNRPRGAPRPPQATGSDPANTLMMRPPRDAKDPDGAKAPGKPSAAEEFEDPKGGERWVPNPNGQGNGWLDAKGDVWVPTGQGSLAHGGPHWDVQSPGGGNRSVYPGGKERISR